MQQHNATSTSVVMALNFVGVFILTLICLLLHAFINLYFKKLVSIQCGTVIFVFILLAYLFIGFKIIGLHVASEA